MATGMRPLYWALIAFAALILVMAIVVAYLDRPTSLFGSAGAGAAGERGDYWGGHFAAAGSLAAAILFLVAILLQRDELIEQRKELALTREEMTRARGVSTVQAEQLTKQTEIAKHSAVVGRIIEVLQFRSSLKARQRGLNILVHHQRHEYQSIDKQVHRSDAYLRSLLTDPILGDDERAHLAEAAELDDQEAVLKDYVSLNFEASSRPDQSLQLTCRVVNNSQFNIIFESVNFCCPNEVYGVSEIAEPATHPWTIEAKAMRHRDQLKGFEVLGGTSMSFHIPDWRPASRQRVEMIPAKKFSIEAITTDEARFTLQGEEIKRVILDNIRS